ncbi:endoplasmic reticulum membrane sensor NFE2L1 [Microcaecilia unicolor]|uniref:Endoplasmic reticulum membrane sensor NFE2L1 n=1 Tax=Microcaecilia unicolor TaxID=1415580 RepID=A0A6P7ZUX7_9AMPH|nr:endoplasmic reticulum membrane sensor NFE2L1 [Microcaecilia unicolor]XP_030077310.1 endoplasmic reticulum membrane sensor NFE2L1 [Microcaecilia unicolor]XP_030077311.1 endoplasmic reticulum membrane sensor NFE2L1 [Microcaecilia unicolor]XP_030077312.1 endoplasmic reticulum membrane sensor NFE2L1 [Microcaecilia unicolor]XP_030077313.1 endoplasmic reticulum membrane sensor NFE2L1 [Microcaecilia unicolor]XP_030077315.1 endoplasmic reticulum membrane sensor NFE2L1 [Microcaecilia unicolor]XP_03
MLSLKKYFTEGLIQFTILLSLIGVRLDVDTYLDLQLPPLREIILGPSSAYSPAQFHNLRNTLDGYGIHPKSVDLDYYFTTRRLLNQVRALDRLQVPGTAVDTWLVHREQESSVSSTQPSPSIALENPSGLQDVLSPDLGPRESGSLEQVYGEELEALGAVAPLTSGDLTKEDIDLIDILWKQDIDLGAGREIFNYSHRQKDSEVDKEPSDDTESNWRDREEILDTSQLVDGETGESIPVQDSCLEDQTTLSLEECLRLLEATFPFGENSELPDAVSPNLIEDVHRTGMGLSSAASDDFLSPLRPDPGPSLDLEQQWQDLMSVMEMQAVSVNRTATDSLYNSTNGDLPPVNYSLSPSTAIHQNVSLHQALLPSCTPACSSFFSGDTTSSSAFLQLSPDSSTDLNSTLGSNNMTEVLFQPQMNNTVNETSVPALVDPLGGLLDEAMLDEISLMELALEEGFSQVQASQLEEEFDSDSGLSLDSDHSPVSPSSSESSSCSFSEEGAVGYTSDSETVDLEGAEGAVGYQPQFNKFCRMSYQNPLHFQYLPHLEYVGHNHTYNMAPEALENDLSHLAPIGKKTSKEKEADFTDRQMSRDEHRARALKIPFTNEKIINLPVEEFNEMLAKYQLSETQLSLVRDIRRRGKNKMAAQNCRKRKLDTILNLEQDVQELQQDKTRLLKEKVEFLKSIQQMKQKVQNLYQEVFDCLRNESGQPYSPNHYSLQYASNGSIILMPRTLADQQGRRRDRKQKDRRK